MNDEYIPDVTAADQIDIPANEETEQQDGYDEIEGDPNDYGDQEEEGAGKE